MRAKPNPWTRPDPWQPMPAHAKAVCETFAAVHATNARPKPGTRAYTLGLWTAPLEVALAAGKVKGAAK